MEGTWHLQTRDINLLADEDRRVEEMLVPAAATWLAIAPVLSGWLQVYG